MSTLVKAYKYSFRFRMTQVYIVSYNRRRHRI